MTFSGKPKTMIPKGVATLLPDGTSHRRLIEKEILSSFSRWGYQEVTPPIFEYLDVFSLGVGEEILDSAYKFVDRATGRIMVLRPDVTPQIARIASTLLSGQARPLRLCYSANVFRHQEEHAGRERELFQIGGELIGFSDAEADAEMIALSIEVLQGLGLRDFRITLGQMAFTRGLLRPFMASPAFYKKILHYVAKKEASQLEQWLKQESVDQKTQKEVLSLLDLFGGEAVLERASRLTDDAACRQSLERLEAVYALLKSAGHQEYIIFDLGEVRGFDYYTGTIFEIFTEGVGSELGGGGRYDHLLEKFGAPSPSTGFALYIERIQSAIEKSSLRNGTPNGVDLLLVHSPDDLKRAIALAKDIRKRGYRVIQKSFNPLPLKEAVLEEAAGQSISKVALLPEEAGMSTVQLFDVLTGKCETCNQENLISRLDSNETIT